VQRAIVLTSLVIGPGIGNFVAMTIGHLLALMFTARASRLPLVWPMIHKNLIAFPLALVLCGAVEFAVRLGLMKLGKIGIFGFGRDDIGAYTIVVSASIVTIIYLVIALRDFTGCRRSAFLTVIDSVGRLRVVRSFWRLVTGVFLLLSAQLVYVVPLGIVLFGALPKSTEGRIALTSDFATGWNEIAPKLSSLFR
jgi:hypothetical protein